MSGSTQLAVTVCALVAACGTALGDATVTESFEAGFGQWLKDSSVVGAQPFQPSIARVTDVVHTGSWAAQMRANGTNGNGALWLESKYALAPGRYDVKVSFWVWSPHGSDAETWNVAASIGTTDPETQGDLCTLGRAGAQAGWHAYSLAKTVSADAVVFVAVGLSTSVNTDANYVFDDVEVEIAQALCPGDFDHSGHVGIGDIFAFLGAWFSGNLAADYDRSGQLTSQDVFVFLNEWLAGC